MDGIYQRQQTLDLQMGNGTYFVVGCGGTGMWTAFMLAMSGAKKLFLFDSDKLELSNLNRLPFTTSDIGKRKTTVLAKFLRRIRPEIEIRELGHFSLETIPMFKDEDPDTIYCCTDNWKSQVLVRNYCTYYMKDGEFTTSEILSGPTFIRIGYDGAHISVRHELPAWGKEEGMANQDGYNIVPSWVVPSALAACIGVAKGMYRPARRIETNGNIEHIIRRG